MAQTKISFEQFMESVDEDNKPFVDELHKYLLEKGCKVNFEEKKNGFLASYKIGKPQRALLNFAFRKKGMHTRIYGERISGYADFLNTLPSEMLNAIQNSSICKRLVHNTCSPKCIGYDFIIGDEHFQKCRYGCFEFLMTSESKPHIHDFIEHEIMERLSAQAPK